jgi:hypothetical protein
MADINVIGVAPNDAVAHQLIGNLRIAGFDQEDISLLMVTHEEENEQLAQDDSQADEGVSEVAGNAAKGAAIGGVTGVLAGLGTLAIPGIGPVIGTGVLLAMFGGMGAGIGGLLGLYSSETVSSQVIERYGMALREGQAIVSVTVPDTETAEVTRDIFVRVGATNINSYMADDGDLADTPGITDVTEKTQS